MTDPIEQPTPVVLDTNIILDLFVFKDPATISLQQALDSGAYHWIATQPMREELERVLTYKHIAPRIAFHQLTAGSILAQFDKFAALKPVACKASVNCEDPDDQKFIDLAVAHKSLLLSKDHAVLCMAKRLVALDVDVKTQLKVSIVVP